MKHMLSGVAALTALMTSQALAHTGLEGGSGFAAGIGHPVGGLDHVLAMVAVGVLAVQMSMQTGRQSALWLVPVSFVVFMAVGGVLGMIGVTMPMVEQGIVGSVIILGAVIAWGRVMPQAAAMIFVGVLAMFHGHAHGTEMPLNASGVEYAMGFMLATASLHALGVGLGLSVQKVLSRSAPLAARIGGGVIALGGLGLVVA